MNAANATSLLQWLQERDGNHFSDQHLLSACQSEVNPIATGGSHLPIHRGSRRRQSVLIGRRSRTISRARKNTKEGMPKTATINISCRVEEIKPWAFFREEPPHPIDSISLGAFDSSYPSDRSRAAESYEVVPFRGREVYKR